MSNSSNDYFDLHTSGLGYLQRAREVKPGPGKRFTPFWAVDINAIHGPKNAVNFVYFDCRVSGTEAMHVIQDLVSEINNRDRKVLVSFKIGDLLPDIYDKNGETRISLKARLLRVAWVKIDGIKVYTAPQVQESEYNQNGDALSDQDDRQPQSTVAAIEHSSDVPAATGTRLNGTEHDILTKTGNQGIMSPSGYSMNWSMPG
ncbi:MAG: DUF3577 domain-containing protein [Candidatus Thiodiazotropha sp. (ex Lucinoma borealis)]|nr:DUF3577 domain-containing protein [Candidatus Thiodiazotropha sp. (ex Lucinoma borealis)]MCU7865402.1 DUF3577 domain-containing protein [Candidatus Thiodiazotropha sp. (ex Lucinoma borealis)]